MLAITPGDCAAEQLYLQQLPSEADGLAGTERRGLMAVAAGARDFADIYRAVTADDDPPWLGDHRAFRRP